MHAISPTFFEMIAGPVASAGSTDPPEKEPQVPAATHFSLFTSSAAPARPGRGQGGGSARAQLTSGSSHKLRTAATARPPDSPSPCRRQLLPHSPLTPQAPPHSTLPLGQMHAPPEQIWSGRHGLPHEPPAWRGGGGGGGCQPCKVVSGVCQRPSQLQAEQSRAQ